MMADYKQKMGIYDKDHPRSSRINFERYKNPADKYGSIREFGTEERIKGQKSDALKDLATGVALAPVGVLAETLAGEMPKTKPTPMGGGADYLASRGRAAVKGVKDAANFIGNAASSYKSAKGEEEDLDRELANQMKRETRGMKKGGKVSASSRADGIAKRGKTKGRMI